MSSIFISRGLNFHLKLSSFNLKHFNNGNEFSQVLLALKHLYLNFIFEGFFFFNDRILGGLFFFNPLNLKKC